MRLPLFYFFVHCFAVTASFAATIPLVEQGTDWRYYKGTNEPPVDWPTVPDDALDNSWLTDVGGFGFGDGDDATVLNDMQGNYTTVYIRKSFSVTNAFASNDLLRLAVDFDDGYIAYLDGVEIARSSNVPSAPHPFDLALASDSDAVVDGGVVEITDLGVASNRLAVGTHILAVQGINGDLASSDLSLNVNLYVEDEGPPVNPGTNTLSGSIISNTTLYASQSVYQVTGDVTVEAGVVLTVEAGVTLAFDEGTGMTVLGCLQAEGTALEPIRFTRSTEGTRWERIIFIEADPCRFAHCIFEFADCEGDHKDYYDADNDPGTLPAPRNYFQALVGLACHLEFDHCLFQDLPDDGSGGEGDVIAMISDDRDFPGAATARILNSEFVGVGQGIHTRFAHVYVEGCTFTEHNGDNDDIDLYGESIPPSLIVNNTFLDQNSDDAINPTRCSAVMIGNRMGHTGTSRQGDSAVVLRDRGCPVMINNVIFNVNSAGIDVQNTCDAFLINNTLVNCGTGINFRDHTSRWGAPYYLYPGAAKATVINSVIWDCGRSFNLVDSPSTTTLVPASIATVLHCNVEGGQGSANVAANSMLNWGAGNISVDPMFSGVSSNVYRLTAGSPCIDAGTNMAHTISITNLTGAVTALTFSVTADRDGVPRPLDGDGDGEAAFDLGAYEYLLPSADSNSDGIPDGWTLGFGLDPVRGTTATENPDGDGLSTLQEWIADTDPTDGGSFLQIESVEIGDPLVIHYRTSENRRYTLYVGSDLGGGGTIIWEPVVGAAPQDGSGGVDAFSVSDPDARKVYRVGVALP